MYFVSFCSRFIDRFAPCVLFRRGMWAHQFTVTLTCTNANETVAIDVLVVVYNKTWENRVMLTLHGQLVLDIRPRCWLRMLKLTRLRLVNFYHPQSTSLPNIQHYLIMTRWITLHYPETFLEYSNCTQLPTSREPEHPRLFIHRIFLKTTYVYTIIHNIDPLRSESRGLYQIFIYNPYLQGIKCRI